MATCKSCGERILWKTTSKGNKMPVNYDPDLTDDDGEEFDPERMESHFASCVYANQHRSKR